MSVQHHDDVEQGIQHLKDKGFQVYAAHFSEHACPFQQVDFTIPCALVLGAEKNGISFEAANLSDQHIIIPMQGMVGSYNVSVAAAVILVEAQRQRQAKGLYDVPRLPREVYQPTLFRWGYPELARYCDDRNLEYPEINDTGQLVNPSDWYARIQDGHN